MAFKLFATRLGKIGACLAVAALAVAAAVFPFLEEERQETAGARNADGRDIGLLLRTADAGKGQRTFKKCKACHTTRDGGSNKVGPNLWNVVGREKAAVKRYKYSAVMNKLGGRWDYKDMDAFLAGPKAFAKGNKMSFIGLKKAAERADLIAYLRSLSDQPAPLP